MPVQPLSSEQLDIQIVGIVRQHNMSYLDAVMFFCEQRQLEPEDVAPLLGEKIKLELLVNGQALNLLPRAAALY